MDENSCVLLPLTTQLKKAEYLECVLCPGTASALPAKWWQCLKSSSKAMLQNKRWCKSCEEDPTPASQAIYCEFTHHLLSGAAYCHSWGQDLGLRTVERLNECSSHWLGWKGCAPAHLCSAQSGSPELCPGYPGRRHRAQLCPALHCSRGGLVPCRAACREFMSLISPQPVHSEPLQVCQGNNSNLRILLCDFHIPVHFLNCCVALTLGF